MVNGKPEKQNILEKLGKVYIGILLLIFGGIVLHAPLSVGLGTLFPDYSLLIKSWKEILVLVAGLILLFLLYKKKRFNLLPDPIIVAIGIYALLHIILIFFSPENSNISLIMAGLAIDLRYILFFGLVYLAIKLYPKYYKLFIKIGIIGAIIVLGFALLQVFVLPNDILKYIGYNINTISSFLTVDQNPDFIRINSTLRGPNPLGAYAVITLAIIISALVKRKVGNNRRVALLVAVLSVGSIVALWSSYSRSALIAAVVAATMIFSITSFRKLSTKMWITIGVVLVVLAGSFIMARNTSFVSNVLLHDNPSSGDGINSNEGHVDSIKESLDALPYQPMGAGIGSTGSASLYGDNPIIIENQYLFVAHETGWFGLILFTSIFGAVIIKLWGYRRNWLALGVMASGIGLAIIGLLLPVWVDDTVSIIWWGLAAIVLGYGQKIKEL